MLKKLSNVYHGGERSTDYYTNKASVEHSIQLLHKKFKDFEHIFNYYLTSTREFFTQNSSKG